MRVILSANIGRGVAGPAEVRVGYAFTDGAGRRLGTSIDRVQLQPRGTGADASWSLCQLGDSASGPLRRPAGGGKRRRAAWQRRVQARCETRPGEGAALSDVLILDPMRPAGKGLATVVDGRVIGPGLEVYFEAYPLRGRAVSAVAFDIADQPDGPPVVGVRTKPVSAEEGRRWSASADIDVRLLPPGDYVLVGLGVRGRHEAGAGQPALQARIRRSGHRGGRAPGGVRRGRVGRACRPLRPAGCHDAGCAAVLPRASAAGRWRRERATVGSGRLGARGKFDEAIAALADAGSDRLSVPFLKGLALFGKGDLVPASEQFREALRLDSEFLPAAFYLGACYAAGGQDRQAAGAWQTSLISESEARIVYDVLADALLRLGDGEQAESIIREALGRWPEDDSFVPRLSAAEAMQRRSAEAMATLEPYLERHPADASAWFLAMRVLYDAHAAGGVVTSRAEDGARAARYAEGYKAAAGPRLGACRPLGRLHPEGPGRPLTIRPAARAARVAGIPPARVQSTDIGAVMIVQRPDVPGNARV